ncbi:MAG: hypothetical protein EOP89_03965 [Lysobacteraceae bacterium]|nr:MAG: hypothetical protein EOP89_03965 [Xanthomonadaceae bacterium]
MTPAKDSFRSFIVRWWEATAVFVIAVLFWLLVGVIAIVATAQSEKQGDTFIAALAMGSQAFFAYQVWKLTKQQQAFASRTAERQHKIDMYPLRKVAADRLEEMAVFIIPPRPITEDGVEAFRQCHLEINKLFSDTTDDLAFELYQVVEEAHRYMRPVKPVYDDGGSIVVPGDAGLTDDAHAYLDDAFSLYTDLQNAVADEMRIR